MQSHETYCEWRGRCVETAATKRAERHVPNNTRSSTQSIHPIQQPSHNQSQYFIIKEQQVSTVHDFDDSHQCVPELTDFPPRADDSVRRQTSTPSVHSNQAQLALFHSKQLLYYQHYLSNSIGISVTLQQTLHHRHIPFLAGIHQSRAAVLFARRCKSRHITNKHNKSSSEEFGLTLVCTLTSAP